MTGATGGTRIFVPAGVKERLLNYLLFDLKQRAASSSVGLAIHGLIVLAGPPGTGKTTLAGGLADEAARVLDDGPVLFVDIDPHAFPSQLLGESQRSRRAPLRADASPTSPCAAARSSCSSTKSNRSP